MYALSNGSRAACARRGRAAHDDPFLIVDRELAVQAVSRNAELVLSVDEPASLGVSVEEFLITCNGDRALGELAQLVEAAFAGVQPSSTLELLSAANSEIRLQVRVTSCGAPQARCWS